jgi:PAS domain S-box-containing protein
MSEWIIAGCLAASGVLAWMLHRSRQQLRGSRELLAVLARDAPLGVLIADAAGQCTYANPTWCRLSGLSMEETVGQRWSRAVHPEDLPGVMERWEESVRDQRPYVCELRLLRPDRGVRRVLAAAGPTHDPAGRLTGFIGTVLDITERVDAERAAREKDSLLRTLLDYSSAAIYLKDTSGRYLLANRRHQELWPAMDEFRPGTTPADWFAPEVARSFIESDAAVWRSGKPRTFEETIPSADGQRTFLTIKFPVFDEAGGIFAVGGISADVSEIKEARRVLAEREMLLRRLIEIQESEKQSLCHEFHDGLIQYAVGSKMLLESLRESPLPEGVLPGLDSVIDCLAKGIADGRRAIRGIRPAVLDDLGLEAALEELAGEIREARIAVELQLTAAIDGIPSPLQTTVYRVVQESLNNARKHSGTARIRLAVTIAAGELAVDVEDFGCGFDPATLSRDGLGLLGLKERVRLAGGRCS